MITVADPQAASPQVIAERLDEARCRTLDLVAPLTDEQLNRAYSEILSPLAWDLGHIANFEELWLVQQVGGMAPLDGRLGRIYDAIENPRAIRNELPILRGDDLRAYMAEVRARALEVLDAADLTPDAENPLLRNGFAYELILAHEHQHNETMLQLLQMAESFEPVRSDPGPAAEPVADGPAMVTVAAGEYEIGAPADGFAYDNERPAHIAVLAEFRIDRTPVTNGDFARFVEETGAEPPLYWRRGGEGSWSRRAMGREAELDPALPVVHVDHPSAQAFARWAGKRLPTELEWEAAASGADPGRANLDQLAFGTAPAGAYADAPSACGAVQMLGDVWEWTDSTFTGYEGFEAFPYREYSEVFFGDDYRVLRGGAWATRRSVIRASFRNWDLPQRRQIFSGLRCVESV